MFDFGETVPFKSLEERKDLYKVSFSINILYYDEWLWAETPWWTRRSCPTHQLKVHLAESRCPHPLWESAPKPIRFQLSSNPSIPFWNWFSNLSASFAAIILNKLSWIFCQLRCKKIVHYWPPCFTCNRRTIFTH